MRCHVLCVWVCSLYTRGRYGELDIHAVIFPLLKVFILRGTISRLPSWLGDCFRPLHLCVLWQRCLSRCKCAMSNYQNLTWNVVNDYILGAIPGVQIFFLPFCLCGAKIPRRGVNAILRLTQERQASENWSNGKSISQQKSDTGKALRSTTSVQWLASLVAGQRPISWWWVMEALRPESRRYLIALFGPLIPGRRRQ